MGKITDANRRALENAVRYEDAALTGMEEQDFAAALSKLIEEKKVSVLSIVEHANVSKSYVNKLRSPSEKPVRPSRHVILDIALAINASLEETNHLLKTARYQELYARDPAEALIIWGMLKGLDGEQIRELLREKGLDALWRE